jgi:hypothetical protein
VGTSCFRHHHDSVLKEKPLNWLEKAICGVAEPRMTRNIIINDVTPSNSSVLNRCNARVLLNMASSAKEFGDEK